MTLKFKEVGIQSPVLESVEAMGYETTTPIQEQAIPIILNGKDLIACAQTGTGKTAAFLLPTIQQIQAQEDHGSIDALVIVPTRELAIQIDQQIQGLGYFVNISSLAIYGGGDGTSWDVQKKALVNGANVIIATPGRLIAHLNQEYVDLSKVKHFILDEADRMLDMGFYDDIKKIMEGLPAKRQNLMFSATMPPKMRKLAKEVLNEPEELNIAISKPSAAIVQAAFMVYDGQKLDLIKHLLKAKPLESVFVFLSKKSEVDRAAAEIKKIGINAEAIHSGLEQSRREVVLQEFINKKINVLVATDVMSRGIDIKGIDMVINYNVPGDAEDYVHRIGRTGRAEAKGIAFTFVNEEDMFKFSKIEELIEKDIRKVPLPEYIGEGPEYNPKASSKFRGSSRPKRGFSKRK
ncbi:MULTISPECIES: DEAD/DEAH box helicase [Reichenbachiella]|uniref:Superfamily II DNA and RNA helicase n=1 Tax=Reichenbachiella agariperforans TaxID=156994 RepID=A0A1M6UZM5_REIAG|nr:MULTISPECIES: DEAD/DEAH box helicase [Reichenbachiella]RJE72717.1 ATP-dependent RNA helicase [Reichenbachiella sp. MSK19-1]SHK74545.1 Superfamily II DNA and RNA helicase [Reichenbachiella agariperforans]